MVLIMKVKIIGASVVIGDILGVVTAVIASVGIVVTVVGITVSCKCLQMFSCIR